MADQLELYGSKILRQKSQEVKLFNDELVMFGEKLVRLMYEFDGVGLAAVQIGRPIRMAAIYVPNSDSESLVLVNPRIIWMSEETQSDSEGCLSVPEIRAPVNRSMSISVSAVSPAGEPILLEKISGAFARTILHEMDHMDGILFVDKIDPLKKTLLFGKLKKLAKKHKTK